MCHLVRFRLLSSLRVMTMQQAAEGVGKVGTFFGYRVRQAFYERVLAGCGCELEMNIGATIAEAASRMGDRLWVGSGSYLDRVEVDDDVLIAPGATVLARGGNPPAGHARCGRSPQRQQRPAPHADRRRCLDRGPVRSSCSTSAGVDATGPNRLSRSRSTARSASTWPGKWPGAPPYRCRPAPCPTWSPGPSRSPAPAAARCPRGSSHPARLRSLQPWSTSGYASPVRCLPVGSWEFQTPPFSLT